MKAREYQTWIGRAFHLVEGALGAEMATPTRTVITEDYLRASFLRGVALAHPDGAVRVRRELDVSWSGAPCIAGDVERNGPWERVVVQKRLLQSR